MAVFAFDIETVPDVDGGRRLFGLEELSDGDVARAMFHRRRQQTGGSDFLPLHLHRVAAISVAMREGESLRVWSLGEPESDERELVQRFFDGIDRYSPDLVSWNGSGFDLPVLHYRALVQGVSAPRYWETGDFDQPFRFNNYLNRFHWRHTDLMDVLAGFQPRAAAKLDEMAVLCGLPGKLGMDGSQVWDAVHDGRIGDVRDYCETDALNTYLLYLRFERMRGRIDDTEYARNCEVVRQFLAGREEEHFRQFLAAWDESGRPDS